MREPIHIQRGDICHQGVSDSHHAGSLIVMRRTLVLGTPESVSLLVQDNQYGMEIFTFLLICLHGYNRNLRQPRIFRGPRAAFV
jgi:hypothetical protein